MVEQQAIEKAEKVGSEGCEGMGEGGKTNISEGRQGGGRCGCKHGERRRTRRRGSKDILRK